MITTSSNEKYNCSGKYARLDRPAFLKFAKSIVVLVVKAKTVKVIHTSRTNRLC